MRSDHLHAIGRFRMPESAEVVAVKWVGYDLHRLAVSGFLSY